MSEEAQKVQLIINNCNEMINGKFILASNKITQILKSIAECQMVYEILADCVSNFEFEVQFKRSCVRMPNGKSHFVMPTRGEEILAMVFCIFVNIENKTIDFATFLHSFFVKNNDNEFDTFCKELVIPFRRNIEEMLFALQDDGVKPTALTAPVLEETEEEEEVVVEAKPQPKQHTGFYEKVLKHIRLMNHAMKTADRVKSHLRQEFFWVTDAMLLAIQMENAVLVNGLMVALERIAHEIKPLRQYYQFMRLELSQQTA